MEDPPCKNCLILVMCKNRYKEFALERLYTECSLLRTYILQNSGMPVSGIYCDTLDTKELRNRLKNAKKYLSCNTTWV